MLIRITILLILSSWWSTGFSQEDCYFDLRSNYQNAKNAYQVKKQPLAALAYLQESLSLLEGACINLTLENRVIINDSLLVLLDNILTKETGSGVYKSFLKILNPFFISALSNYFDYYQSNPSSSYAVKIIELIEKNKAISQKLSTAISNQALFSFQNKISLFKEKKQKAISNDKVNYQSIRVLDDSINYYVAKLNDLTKMETLATSKKSLTIEQIQKKLKADEVLILFQAYNDYLYLGIIITNNSIALTKLPSQIAYSKQIDGLLTFKKQDYHAFIKASTALYNSLFKPFATIIYKKNRLFIIRDVLLSQVPIEVLISRPPKNTDGNFGKLSYLVNKYSVVYLNTIQSLLSRESSQLVVVKPLIFSPIFDYLSSKTSNIPSIETSIDFINYIQEKYELSSLKREKATITNFKKLGKFHPFIHLDTHTFIDNKNVFNQSKVAFAPEAAMDSSIANGFLTLNDIYLLDAITPKVLILGSCNTGTGRNEIGEGIISIAYNFRLKGIKNIIYTSWSVEETATHEIFKRFYDYLALEIPIDKALQQAKIEFIQQNSSWKNASNASPYYWAGLSLNGTPVKIKLDEKSPNKFRSITSLSILILLIFCYFYQKRKKLTLG